MISNNSAIIQPPESISAPNRQKGSQESRQELVASKKGRGDMKLDTSRASTLLAK
jgi:hypothetical protein